MIPKLRAEMSESAPDGSRRDGKGFTKTRRLSRLNISNVDMIFSGNIFMLGAVPGMQPCGGTSGTVVPACTAPGRLAHGGGKAQWALSDEIKGHFSDLHKGVV